MSFSLRLLPDDPKVCDLLAPDSFTRLLPTGLVADALDASGARERRTRKLSQSAVVYLLIAVGLHGHASVTSVIDKLWRSASFLFPDDAAAVAPSGPAFVYRRKRLGVRPLAALFRAVCRPLATPDTPGAFRFGLRLVGIDGTKEEVPNTPANERAFGRAGSQRGPAAFVQILCVHLVEIGTHAVLDTVIWPWDRSEQAGLFRLLRSVGEGMLLLLDRGLYSYNVVEAVREREAHVLVRLSSKLKPRPVRRLADGSMLCEIRPTKGKPGATKRRPRGAHQLVRIITYRMAGPAGAGQTYRLLTTLLDELQAPALEVARCYHERWEVELVIDEIDEHQRVTGRPLRSKSPEGVMQELYAVLIGHYLIRALMAEAAAETGTDPDRLSFVGALRIVQETLPMLQVLSGPGRARVYERMIAEIGRKVLPERTGRSNPRVIRRKMSRWLLKRDKHEHWPQCPLPTDERIELLI